MKSDLNRVKDLIDAYDLLISKGINTIQDLQEVVYVLKGYEGTDLAEFLETLKVNKAIKVDGMEGSGVDTITVDLPVEAIESLEKMLRKNIYRFGRGIDFGDEALGGEMRTATVDNIYQRLDLKANQLIRQLQLAIVSLCWFYAKYHSIKPGGTQDFLKVYDKANLQINKNKMKSIQECKDSFGIISRETIIENHPFVKNVEAELERIKNEYTENPPINFNDSDA